MPHKETLVTLAGAMNALITSDPCDPAEVDETSLWVPRVWTRTTPFVIDDVVIQPLGQQQIGLEMIYDIPKMCHLIKTILIHIKTPPHTVVPLGAAAVVDFYGFAQLENLTVNFSSNLVYQTQDYDLYFRHRKTRDIEHTAAHNELVGGDLTIAQRTLDLENGREYYVDPFLPWTDHQTRCLPIHTLSQKMRIIHRPRVLQNLTVSNIYPAVPTITQAGQYTYELIMKQVHLAGEEADMILGMSQDDLGISYMIHHPVRQQTDEVMSTANGYMPTIKLSSFTRPMKLFHFALIPRKLVDNTGRNDMFFFAATPSLGPTPPGMTPYAPLDGYEINANSLIIQRRIPRQYDRVYNHQLYFSAPHGDEIYNQTYSEFPQSFSAGLGYLEMANLSNTALTLYFGTGGTGTDPDNPVNAQVLRLIVNGLDYNFHYYCKGNFNKSFV